MNTPWVEVDEDGSERSVDTTEEKRLPVKATGISEVISPTITTSSGVAYSANDCIGGKLTLTNAARVAGGTTLLHHVFLVDKDDQKPNLEILIFNSDPTSGTYTDNAATVIGNDDAKQIGRITVATSDWTTVAGKATAELPSLGRLLKASGSRNLYAVIHSKSTPTYGSTSGLVAHFGFFPD